MNMPFMAFAPRAPLLVGVCIPRAAASVGLGDAVGFMAYIIGMSPMPPMPVPIPDPSAVLVLAVVAAAAELVAAAAVWALRPGQAKANVTTASPKPTRCFLNGSIDISLPIAHEHLR
jgi:hypothetical protein